MTGTVAALVALLFGLFVGVILGYRKGHREGYEERIIRSVPTCKAWAGIDAEHAELGK